MIRILNITKSPQLQEFCCKNFPFPLKDNPYSDFNIHQVEKSLVRISGDKNKNSISAYNVNVLVGQFMDLRIFYFILLLLIYHTVKLTFLVYDSMNFNT